MQAAAKASAALARKLFHVASPHAQRGRKAAAAWARAHPDLLLKGTAAGALLGATVLLLAYKFSRDRLLPAARAQANLPAARAQEK